MSYNYLGKKHYNCVVKNIFKYVQKKCDKNVSVQYCE